MSEAGVQWVRFVLHKGTQTQCAPDKFYTNIASALRSRNMKALVYVAIPNPTTTTATAGEISEFTTWLNTMASCYKDDFKYWEIGNEPNLSAYWNIDDDVASDQSAYEDSVEWYYEYLESGYTTIKAIDPGATVIHAGLSQYKSDRWYEVMETINPSSYIDAMAFHPYSDLGPDGNINYINRLYTKMQTIFGMENKPIWITEIGYTADVDQYPGNTSGSETLKASYLSSSYQKMLDWGISTPIFWFNFSQDPNVDAPGCELMYSDRSAFTYIAQCAYTAMKNLWSGSFSPSGIPNAPHNEVSSTSKPYCSDATPGGSPELFQITAEDTSATIYFSPAQGPINSYHISYGHETGNYMYGAIIPGKNDDGVRSFTIGGLKPNTEYFFKVMPIHGCAPGVSSNELSARTAITSDDTFSYYK